MTLFNFFRRLSHSPTRPPSEGEVITAARELQRKEQLIAKFTFLSEDIRDAARETAVNRFLDVLLSHIRS